MGVTSYLNLFEASEWPSDETILEAPRAMSLMPIHAMRGLAAHAQALDAIVWFSKEAQLGYLWATRSDYHRRLVTDEEGKEIMRTRLWAAEQAQLRHAVETDDILAAVQFLCAQWAEWHREGRPLIADAYKMIAAQGVRLGCLVSRKTADEYRTLVGCAGGYFKPIMDVIWPD